MHKRRSRKRCGSLPVTFECFPFLFSNHHHDEVASNPGMPPLNGNGRPATTKTTTPRAMYAGYAGCPTKAAAQLARCREMIVLLVRSFVSFAFFTEDFFAPVWGECSHVFHMHCLLKWISTSSSKQQCPMDRRTWGMSSLFSLASLFAHAMLQ